jgi:CheY-like chemotaxis protein
MEESIEFKIILDPHLDVILGDASQVGQITMNLCINARDAMPKGGRLIVETHNIDIDKEFCRRNPEARPGRYVMLVISDTGMGMDSGTVNRLFEPFSNPKDISKGKGLGLATVYGIVKQHGGLVSVTSEVGKGTTFRVYFPSSTGRPTQLQLNRTTPSVAGNETILVAEDHQGMREVANEILTSHGYKTILAGDGLEALRLFRQDPLRIDLAILDVAIPGLSGTEVFAQMSAIRPDLPVVFTSGHTAESTSLNSKITAGAAFLQKPFALKTLCQIVRSTLNRHRQSSSKSSLDTADGGLGSLTGTWD